MPLSTQWPGDKVGSTIPGAVTIWKARRAPALGALVPEVPQGSGRRDLQGPSLPLYREEPNSERRLSSATELEQRCGLLMRLDPVRGPFRSGQGGRGLGLQAQMHLVVLPFRGERSWSHGDCSRAVPTPILGLLGRHSFLPAIPELQPICEPGKGTALKTLSVRRHPN